MSQKNLEKRVEMLEQEITIIRETFEKLKETKLPWWERNAGIFQNNELFDQAIKEGKAYRDSIKKDDK